MCIFCFLKEARFGMFRKLSINFVACVVGLTLLSVGFAQQANNWRCLGYFPGTPGRSWQCALPAGGGCHQRHGFCEVDEVNLGTFSGNGFVEVAYTSCVPSDGFVCTWAGRANVCMTWNAFLNNNCAGPALCVYSQEVSECLNPTWPGGGNGW